MNERREDEQMRSQSATGETFFTRERSFYRQLFSIFTMVALQNLVAYSVNMIDNVMMGSYSQTSLSGAATVNQIFFLVQQTSITVCDANIILASQYYGSFWPSSQRMQESSARACSICRSSCLPSPSSS